MLRTTRKNRWLKKAKFRVQEKILVALTLSLMMGCGASDEEATHPYGDPTGNFYSLAVLNRFDSGLTREMARGKEIFAQYCAICHGDSGDGRGFNAYNLKTNFAVQPFNFTDSTAADKIPFEEVKKAIISGGPAVNRSQYMPPWGLTFSKYDLACVTSWVWHSLMKRGESASNTK